MNDVIEIVASLADSGIYVMLCNQFLGLKSEKFKWLKSMGLFILFSLNGIFLTPPFFEGLENITPIIDIILFIAYSFIFLNGKVWEKLLVAIIPTLTLFPINMITINTIAAFMGNDIDAVTEGGSARIYVLFFSKALFFLACKLLIKIRKKQVHSLNKSQQIIQLSCFLISFIISSLIWNISLEQNEASYSFAVIFILIMFLNVLLYILMCKMQKDNVTKEEFNLLKANLSAQEKLAVEGMKRYTEIKTLRHDMKHYFIVTAELITMNKPNEAKEYIESVINEKINPSSTMINTGSAIIDAAINNKLTACSKNGIKLRCVIDSELAGINDIDISILLSNLLDNAISGCDMTEPKIELSIQNKRSFTYITVKNKISTSVLKDNPTLLTKKEDKNEHGFGIKSIRNIAKKYDGSVDFSEHNGYFVAEVWLKNTNNL